MSRTWFITGPGRGFGKQFAVADAAEPPQRVFFGTAPLAIVEQAYQSRLKTWHENQHIAALAEGR